MANILRFSPGSSHQIGMATPERTRTILQTLLQMDKQFGKGAVLQLGSRNVLPVKVISSGSISVDAALGVGGFPRGRIAEVFGPESSGKTTLALQVIAEAQAAGGSAAFIDAEHALDPAYAKKLGVDIDNYERRARVSQFRGRAASHAPIAADDEMILEFVDHAFVPPLADGVAEFPFDDGLSHGAHGDEEGSDAEENQEGIEDPARRR